MDNRTGKPATHVYTFVGMATLKASHDTSDFMVETQCEPHEDGTLRICEARIDGMAVVWGEGLDGQLWCRENDDIARAAVETWEASEGMAKARALSLEAALKAK